MHPSSPMHAARSTAARGSGLLSGSQLRLHLGGCLVLQDVDLQVHLGEMVALVGPNGAGKSTLLRCLSGRLRPERGTVSLLGRSLDQWAPGELACHRAVLSQSAPGALGFTVAEVVAMGRAPHGPRGRRAAVQRALAAVELEALAERRLSELSGGERQRVHLARVLAQLDPGAGETRPTVLLLDEPTNNLDPRQQLRVLELAAAHVRRSGGACVAVLHDLNLAAGWADRVVLLHQGRVVADGPPEHALAPARVQSTFQLPVLHLSHPETGRPVLVPASPEIR